MHFTFFGGFVSHSILQSSPSFATCLVTYPFSILIFFAASSLYSTFTLGTTAILPYPFAHISFANNFGSPWKHSPGPRALNLIRLSNSGFAVNAVTPFQHANTWKGFAAASRARALSSFGNVEEQIARHPTRDPDIVESRVIANVCPVHSTCLIGALLSPLMEEL
jgi:hypothetical protein